MTGSAKRKGAINRFFDHVEVQPDGCWLWVGSTTNGYGSFRGPTRTVKAHRWLYSEMYGDPVGLDLDHLCRVRACVNPGHLEPVTRRENLQRGTGGVVSLICRRGHWKIGENLYIIPGTGHRVCRTCVRESRA